MTDHRAAIAVATAIGSRIDGLLADIGRGGNPAVLAVRLSDLADMTALLLTLCELQNDWRQARLVELPARLSHARALAADHGADDYRVTAAFLAAAACINAVAADLWSTTEAADEL